MYCWLDGKTVVVTGASGGMGAGIAATLIKKHGCTVIGVARSEPKMLKFIEELGPTYAQQFSYKLFDVSVKENWENFYNELVEEGVQVDVLVNNAGISFVGLLQDMSDAQWSEILNTNLSSVFYCCRSAISHMVSQKSGKIINISSMWGTVGASCEAAYSATKSGMNGLTKALAKELAPSNVQVNAIACGVIDTAMNAQFSEEEREALREEIPAGRFADSEEVAALALTLASGHSYLTGQIIGLDGGYI